MRLQEILKKYPIPIFASHSMIGVNTYKSAYTHEKSCEIIMEGAGRHFDPAVIDAFTAVEAEFTELCNRMGGGAS